MAITLTDDSATVGTTEYFLASDATTAVYQTTTCILQVFVDLTNMAAGDQFRIRVYRKINTSTARTIYDVTLGGAQSVAHVTPSLVVGGASGAWEASVQKIAGTDRSIGWSIATVA